MTDTDFELTPHARTVLGLVDALATRREMRGLSRRELARLAGAGTAVDKYETGAIPSPGLLNVIAVADVLECDVLIVPRETGPGERVRAQLEIADLRERLARVQSTRPWPIAQEMPLAVAGARVQAWHVQALAAYNADRGDGPADGGTPYDYTARQINAAVVWWNERARRAQAELREVYVEPDDPDDVFEPGHTYRSENGYFEFRCERRIGEVALGIETVLKPWTVYPGTNFRKWATVGPSVGYLDVTEAPGVDGGN